MFQTSWNVDVMRCSHWRHRCVLSRRRNSTVGRHWTSFTVNWRQPLNCTTNHDNTSLYSRPVHSSVSHSYSESCSDTWNLEICVKWIFISAKWMEWNWRIYCFHFCVSVCLSVCTQYSTYSVSQRPNVRHLADICILWAPSSFYYVLLLDVCFTFFLL